MPFSDFVVNNVLRDIKDSCWVALHFDSPDQGAYASELIGAGYERLEAHFGTVSNRTVWVDEWLYWSGLAETKIRYITGWNQQYKGDLLFSCPLPAESRVITGAGFTIPAYSIALSFD